MANTSPMNINGVTNVTINTGNILTLGDITKKSGLNTTEELLEAINLTLKDYENGGREKSEGALIISRKHDDTQNKLTEYEQNDLRIGLKVFVNKEDPNNVLESIEKAFNILNVSAVHNVIIAYSAKQEIEGQQNACLEKLKNIWKTLEKLVLNGKVLQIGVADVEETIFKSIYEWAKIKPSIIQINLATCCVVPPTLQSFCKENDVQLLTHSDPIDVLPDSAVADIFSRPLILKWVLRYLVHIKCRGVLTTKGYLLCLSEGNP